MPGFTFICMLTLALGIGATTSIFSAIYHTMLRPMPFEGGDRLVYVWVNDSESGMGLAPPRAYVEAWRGRLHSFESLETYSGGEYTVLGGTEPEVVKGARISQDLPAMLHVEPILGRTFTSDEMQQNGRDIALISEAMWKRRFGGTRDVIGRQLALGDGRKYEIVGVMPNMFASFESFQHAGQVWFPLRADTSATALRDVSVIGRVRPGVSIGTANDELDVIASGVKADMGMPGKWAPKVMTPQAFLGDTMTNGLRMLLAAVAVVLLIGCANIAGLLLVRLNARRREIAIRSAVGARRFTIMRLLMVESILLAIGGGLLGMFLSSWITNAIRTVRPDDLSSLDAVSTDKISIAFAFGVSLVTAVLFGLAPIVAAMRRDLASGLISSGSTGTRVTSGNRTRSIMVAAQVALSLMLLIGSLLLVRSVKKMEAKDLGFDAKNVLTVGVAFPEHRSDAVNKSFFDALIPALRRIPGVTSVSVSTGVPSTSSVMFGEVTVPGRSLTEDEKPGMLAFTGSTPEYAKTIGLRIREGRFLEDGEKGNPVVVSEQWARKLWPAGAAVGKQIHIGNGPDNMTVVGVVTDEATMGPAQTKMRPHIYTPYNYGFPRATIAIRTDGRLPSSLAASVRVAFRNADPTIAARDIASLEDLVAGTIALDRFYMQLLSTFAVLALVLSAIGLYGVISNSVAQRTREIGVRMALGATPGEVQSLVFRQALAIVGAGLVAGGIAAAMLTRFLSAALHGFSPHDPVSFIAAAVVLTTGAVVATYIPARRAVRVDPLDALRTE
jgi:putative ABC transport system permease protein